jgi:MFS family permease
VTTTATTVLPGRSIRAAVGVLVFVELVSGLTQGMTPALVPQLGKELGISPANLNWILAVQLLSAAICVPVISRLGDLHGHRRLLRISLALVLIGAALFAFAPGFGAMLAGQVVLGPLAALLPLELAIVRNRVDPAKARGAIGFLFAAATIGGFAGFTVAGLAHELIGSARGALAVPVVLIGLCVLISLRFVPDTTVRASGRIDWTGALTLGVGLALLLWTLGDANARMPAATLGLLVAAAALLTAWVVIELRSDHPLVDVRTLARPALLRCYLAMFVVGIPLIGSQTIGLTFLSANPAVAGYGLRLSTTSLGPLLALTGIGSILGAVLMSTISRRIGLTTSVLIGLGLNVAGNVLFYFQHQALVLFLTVTPLTAFGTSLAFAALLALVTERIDPADVAMATGMYNTLRAIGGSLGGAVFAFVLSRMTFPGSVLPTLGAYQTAWVIGGACCVAGMIALLMIGNRGGQR